MKYNLTFENIRKSKDLLFESIRGSHLFGLSTETSDTDTFGLFCCPEEYLFDTGRDYQDVVLSEKNDDSWYEIKKFVDGLGKSNPNYLEALFTPEKHILYYDSALDPLWKIRDSLLTKSCFKSFGNYAISQIKKARGLNKAMNINPSEIKVRKSPLEFCYVSEKQGTIKLTDWLENRGLKQKYCGLVSLRNWRDTYGLYYDWGTHLICEYGADFKEKSNLKEVWKTLCKEADDWESETSSCFFDSLVENCLKDIYTEYYKQFTWIEPYEFTGIVNENSDSNEVRVCSVPKNLQPLTTMTYNKQGYESHCADYKRYWDWVENRNPERYEINKGHNYDAKNMSTCIRLMTEAKEIAQGKGLKLDRTDIDRDFLLSIKHHEKSYEEIMQYAERLEQEMQEAFEKSTLPEIPDLELLDRILVEIRKSHYSKKA